MFDLMMALPTEANTAFSSISGNVSDIVAEIWPYLVPWVVAIVTWRLARRGMDKL